MAMNGNARSTSLRQGVYLVAGADVRSGRLWRDWIDEEGGHEYIDSTRLGGVARQLHGNLGRRLGRLDAAAPLAAIGARGGAGAKQWHGRVVQDAHRAAQRYLCSDQS